ncbi:MAG TPA: hypothetical protein VK816_11340 [Jatrophihabitantaceae bacterium]|jgi:hypothetical protein|nr:hypothetical protein [Jatrophihabitantaceae bacterium]
MFKYPSSALRPHSQRRNSRHAVPPLAFTRLPVLATILAIIVIGSLALFGSTSPSRAADNPCDGEQPGTSGYQQASYQPIPDGLSQQQTQALYTQDYSFLTNVEGFPPATPLDDAADAAEDISLDFSLIDTPADASASYSNDAARQLDQLQHMLHAYVKTLGTPPPPGMWKLFDEITTWGNNLVHTVAGVRANDPLAIQARTGFEQNADTLFTEERSYSHELAGETPTQASTSASVDLSGAVNGQAALTSGEVEELRNIFLHDNVFLNSKKRRVNTRFNYVATTEYYKLTFPGASVKLSTARRAIRGEESYREGLPDKFGDLFRKRPAWIEV